MYRILWIEIYQKPAQREISNAQEIAIREYRDSVLKYTGERDPRSSEELIKRVTAAVNACKRSLQSDMDRMLAIADPRNGDGFILEVC